MSNNNGGSSVYYYNPYFPMRPNGTHAKLIGDDFVAFIHRWVEMEVPGAGHRKRIAFVLSATAGVDSVVVLEFPSLRVTTIDAKMVFGVSELHQPPKCQGSHRDYYNDYYNSYYNYY